MAPPLKLVPKAAPSAKEAVRQRVRAAPKPDAMLQCRCGSREVIEARQGVLFKNGRATGGTRAWLCVNCLLHGKRVIVL